MSLKNAHFVDADFRKVATLTVPSERLLTDNLGRIVEDPKLLAGFQCLVEALLEAAKQRLRFGEICVISGAYVVDVFSIGDLTEDGEEIRSIFGRLNGEVDRLEHNSRLAEPLSAAGCGVSTASLAVLRAAADMRATDHTATLVFPGHDSISLEAPSPNATSALPAKEKKIRKVDGEITGLGRGDERGCRIEIGEGASFLVPGLSVERAFELFLDRTQVTGAAKWEEAQYVLHDPAYTRSLGF